jgi:hypothetical protein
MPGRLITLALFLGLGTPCVAQQPRSFAERFLNWSESGAAGREDESEADRREEFVETDRNSFTFAPFTPGRGRLIAESAYSYLNFGGEGAKHSFPEGIVRYGVGDRLELRLGYNFETGAERAEGEGELAGNFGINAEQQALYGFKYALTRQGSGFGLMPHTAFLAQCHTPIGSAEGQSQIRMGGVWGWILPNGWIFDQAIRFGTEREGEDGFTLWAPSTVLRIPFGRERRWFTHVEYFGVMSQARARDTSFQFIDTGLHYFITPDLEVGTTIAFGINDQSRGTIVNCGFGIRF